MYGNLPSSWGQHMETYANTECDLRIKGALSLEGIARG